MKAFLFDHTRQQRVFVYRNLHTKLWSVKAMEGQYAGKVVAHAATVNLGSTKGIRQGKTGIEFKVSEAGRQRVLKEKRKNVHAGIEGYMYHAVVVNERYPLNGLATEIPDDSNFLECVRPDHPAYRGVTYNPYKHDSFVFVDTLEPATITDYFDQDVILEADGKVYIQSLQALSEIVLAKFKEDGIV